MDLRERVESLPTGPGVYLFEAKGDPYQGTLSFEKRTYWGSAAHVWFLGKAYWVLDDGAVKSDTGTQHNSRIIHRGVGK